MLCVLLSFDAAKIRKIKVTQGEETMKMSDVRCLMEEVLPIISHRILYHYIVTTGYTFPDSGP